jgi:adenine-specific DNA-methyltransferase
VPESRITASYSPRAEAVLAPGDCLETLSSLPAGSFQLVVTSPPYNLGKPYEASVPLEDYLASIIPVIEQLVRLLAPSGSLCWQVGNYVADGEVFPLDVFYYHLFKQRGLRLRNRIIWHYGHGLHARRRFSGRHEVLLWFTRSDRYTFHLDPVRVPTKYPAKRHFKGAKKGDMSGHPLGKNPGDLWRLLRRDWESGIWEIPNVKSAHPEKTAHPCQFPIELAERCVLALTDAGDWVLDPFCGAGSALLGALRHQRRAMGCEREESYLSIARARILDHYAGRLGYRPLGTPVAPAEGEANGAHK